MMICSYTCNWQLVHCRSEWDPGVGNGWMHAGLSALPAWTALMSLLIRSRIYTADQTPDEAKWWHHQLAWVLRVCHIGLGRSMFYSSQETLSITVTTVTIPPNVVWMPPLWAGPRICQRPLSLCTEWARLSHVLRHPNVPWLDHKGSVVICQG